MIANEIKTIHQGDAYPSGENAALTWEQATGWSAYIAKNARVYIRGLNYRMHKALTVTDLGAGRVRFTLALTSTETALMPTGDLSYEVRVQMAVDVYVTPIERGILRVLEKLW